MAFVGSVTSDRSCLDFSLAIDTLIAYVILYEGFREPAQEVTSMAGDQVLGSTCRDEGVGFLWVAFCLEQCDLFLSGSLARSLSLSMSPCLCLSHVYMYIYIGTHHTPFRASPTAVSGFEGMP